MDTVTLIGRLLVSLAAVLGLLWVIARRMKRGSHGKRSQLIDVLGRQQLSRTASIAVVRVGEQALVLGVSDTQVSVLAEADLGAVQAIVARTDDAPPVRSPKAPRRAQATATLPGSLIADGAARKPAPLNGSALSPKVWRQTINSLRELTTRQS